MEKFEIKILTDVVKDLRNISERVKNVNDDEYENLTSAIEKLDEAIELVVDECDGKEVDAGENAFPIQRVSNSVVCKINMRPENCYYRDITMECKGCRNNANNCC